MRVNHIHVTIRDLGAAVRWFETVWVTRPTFTNERMAVLVLQDFTLILDAAAVDSAVTIGFHSDDCDADYAAAAARGGVAIQPPTDRPWGARTAYIRGPGGLTLELEQLRGDTSP